MQKFRDLLSAIGSFAAYRRFLQEDTSKAVRYVIFLVVVLSMFTGLRYFLILQTSKDVLVRRIENDVPPFTLTKEGLEVEGNHPHIIDFDQSVLIFDEEGHLSAEVLEPYEIGLYLGSDGMQLRANNRLYNKTYYQDLRFLQVDRERLKLFADRLMLLSFILFLVVVLFRVLGKMIGLFLAALFFWAIARVKNHRMAYEDCFRVSAYAITLPTIVVTLIELMPDRMAAISPVVYYGLFGFYALKIIETIDEPFVNNGTGD